jgi:hypothetical protein
MRLVRSERDGADRQVQRTVYTISLVLLPVGKTVTSAELSVLCRFPDGATVALQRAPGCDGTVDDFSRFAGVAGASQILADGNWIVFTLTATQCTYLETCAGGDAFLMVREVTYDISDIAPADGVNETGLAATHTAVDVGDRPFITIIYS